MKRERTFRGAALANFTECYWSTPPSALEEAKQAGFDVITYAGAEGFAGGMRPVVEQLSSTVPHVFGNVVRAAADSSELPHYRDSCEHLHIVVQKARGLAVG